MVAITSDHSDTRGAVIVSSAVYGNSGGNIPTILPSPRDATGNMIMIDTGREHWPTVQVADVFRRVLGDGSGRGYYVIGNGVYSTVAELTEGGAAAVGTPGAGPRIRRRGAGAPRRLLRRSHPGRSRHECGRSSLRTRWHPSHTTLVDEFLHGNCRK